MANPTDGLNLQDAGDASEEFPQSTLRSFILRVWDAPSGEMRGYLSDVRGHVRHPFKDVAELPALVRSLFHRPPPED